MRTPGRPRRRALPVLLLASTPSWAQLPPMSPEELERWFHDDSEQKALAVSEGELRFLPERPRRADGRPLPHSENILTLTRASLRDGWVALRQCHHGLDAVAEAQVVYRYRRMRDLAVTDTEGIGRAWIEGDSVQLQHVRPGARLCISAAVGVLNPQGEGHYALTNGPYHRKFLDGYYPYHVSLSVRFADTGLRFRDMTPAPRPGLWLTQADGAVTVDAWFEGMLNTELRFDTLP